jgi:BNR repeat-like domain
MHTLVAALLFAVVSNGTPPVREAAVAVSPRDPRVVLAAAINTQNTSASDIPVFRSMDGGQTWSSLGKLPRQLPGRTVGSMWDPVLAFDRDGRAYLAVVAASEPRWMIAVYRSTDNGQSWTGTEVSTATRNDKPWIAIDDEGAIHVAWGQFGSPFSLAYSVSRDRGASFSTPKLFPTVGWPFITVAGENVYLAHTPTFGVLEVLRSSDRGATFGTPVRVASNVGQDPQQLAAHRNHVYAVLAPADGILFTRSSDHGATWTAPVQLSGANGGMMGSINVDPASGELVIAWYEKDSSGRSRIFTTRSTDNGVTLSEPRSVSSSFPASRPVGEYNQLAAQNGIHVAIWADEAGVLSATRVDSNPTPQAPPSKRRSVKR